MIRLKASLELWTGAHGRVHFLTLPEKLADEVRVQALETPRGFGSVRVECTIGDATWRTSLFPVKSGGYFLPVKAAVCRQAGLAPGDEVTVALELL